MKIVRLNTITSTNDYLLGLETTEEVTAVAESQSDGRGMMRSQWESEGRGMLRSHWESEPGKNLTFSMLLHPTWLAADQQFVLSMAHALALEETMEESKVQGSSSSSGLNGLNSLNGLNGGFAIKWPNDIYYGDKKISGTLFECKLQGTRIKDMVIGTGVNINQRQFLSDAPNPVSLAQITGQEYELEPILNQIIDRTLYYVNLAKRELPLYGKSPSLIEAYHQHLYRRQGVHRFRDAEGEFEARIECVKPTGQLVLKRADKTVREYEIKEVKFIL